LGKTRFVAPDVDERFSLGTWWWPDSNEAEEKPQTEAHRTGQAPNVIKGYDFRKTSSLRRWLE